MLISLFSLFTLGAMVKAVVHDCTSNQNCSYSCSTNQCQNMIFNCPTEKGYSCELTCAANLVCTNVTINAGPYVSKLVVNTVDDMQTSNLRVNSEAEVVQINCAGKACHGLDLRITNASQVWITCDSGTYSSSCYSSTWMVTFSEALNVVCREEFSCNSIGAYFNTISKLTFDCESQESCSGNNVSFNSGTQLSVTCVQENSCFSNVWTTNRDDNVALNFPKAYSAEMETWNISKAEMLTVTAIDEGMDTITFSLEDITTFLFRISGFGRTPSTTWYRNNIRNLYLQENGTKSFWLNGSESNPIVCDNNKPCYIRTDTSRTTANELQVICPQDLSGQGGDLCRIYCAGNSDSCNNLVFKANQSSSVILSSVASSGFLVNMNSHEVKNMSQFQLDCVDTGCLNAQVFISGVENIAVNCTGQNGCDGLNLKALDVGKTAYIACSGLESCNSAAFSIAGNDLLETTVQVDSTYPMRQSLWNFENLLRVSFNCLTGGACYNSTVNGYFVKDMQMLCDGATGLACEYGVLNVTDFSNTTLTCTQNGCAQGNVYCPKPMPSINSCNVNCLLSSKSTTDFASCSNMNIYSSSNYAYGNSVNLTCQLTDQIESCEDVTIHCGTEYLCKCPVALEDDDKTWSCNGQCGTEECVESSSSGSKTDSGAIAAAVIIPLIVVIVLVAGGWWWSRRRKQEEVALLKPKDESLNVDTKSGYEAYH